MVRIYEDAKDLHVRNIVVYANPDDSKLYYEDTFKTGVTPAELRDAFLKGALLIETNGQCLVPVGMSGDTVFAVDVAAGQGGILSFMPVPVID